MTHPATALAQELVAIPTTPRDDQREAAALLRDRLAAAGFETALQEYGERTCNVVAFLGDRGSPSLCLSGHLDTVPVEEEQWAHDPHGALIEGDRLWGRGSTDMKGGVASLVSAAEEYACATTGAAPSLSIVLSGGEELGCLGAEALARDEELLPNVHALVIAEPTSNQPLLGHRGAVWLDLVVRGRSCHASTPELGENAIHGLTECVDDVRRWCEASPSFHEDLGPRTMSTGKIGGGVLRNVVPDFARAQLDFRTADEDDWRNLPTNLEGVLGDRAEIRTELKLSPVYSDPDTHFVRRAYQIATSNGVRPVATRAARFFTDASVLTPAMGNPPTVIWGPGSADLAHVVDEWCSIDEIAVAAQMYGELLDGYITTPVHS